MMLAVIGRRRLLLPVPFAIASLQAAFLGLLPNPPLTLDQVKLLKSDNVLSGKLPGLEATWHPARPGRKRSCPPISTAIAMAAICARRKRELPAGPLVASEVDEIEQCCAQQQAIDHEDGEVRALQPRHHEGDGARAGERRNAAVSAASSESARRRLT